MSYIYKPIIAGWGVTPVGAWHSTQTQASTAATTEYIMTVNVTDIARGVQLLDGSKFKVSEAGIYNLQFSAQFDNTDGGGNSAHFDVWLKKNGTAVPYSNTRVSCTPNHRYVVAAWNFVVDLAAGDYLQLAWQVSNAGINLAVIADPGDPVATPSLIVTLNQVG